MSPSGKRLAEDWYERKTRQMVELLGPECEMVMHSLIPYDEGGGLDLYYFPHGIPGTAIATKELCPLPGDGPANDAFDGYELVMFTRQPLALENAENESTSFGNAHTILGAVLNCIARYSEEATLNPLETCEFPEDFDYIGGRCLIFDAFGPDRSHSEFGLLAIIEIHRSEMDFARERGGELLIEKLKSAGYYPYSDLDRPAVA